MFLLVPPSYGDLAVDPRNNLLIISMGPDGVNLGNNSRYLFYICGDKPTKPDSISGIVARQLGYSSCDLTFPAIASFVE